ncbi:hypothetical protein H4582DRAFT_1813115 [Lactarius indigo]|nr:hypothetical protein H4582DRAFT_1813115 [Lactarius indigo]
MLSSTQLAHAARMQVVRENGVRVQFGELWRTQRTVVIFIRHFWCPLCQDYLTSLMRDGDHAALSRSGVRLIVIGCGSYGLIRSYRQIFRLPYELYVDASPGQELYRALGMSQAPSGAHKTRPATEGSSTGSYVRHGAVSGLAMVVAHALRVGMPVWERGGDAAQLGGEFVLGPGLSCTYAHRMQSSAGHAPIVDVLAAAGVRPARKHAGGGSVAPCVVGVGAEHWCRDAILAADYQSAARAWAGGQGALRCARGGVWLVWDVRGMRRGAQHRSGVDGVGRMEHGRDWEHAPHALRRYCFDGLAGQVRFVLGAASGSEYLII